MGRCSYEWPEQGKDWLGWSSLRGRIKSWSWAIRASGIDDGSGTGARGTRKRKKRKAGQDEGQKLSSMKLIPFYGSGNIVRN